MDNFSKKINFYSIIAYLKQGFSVDNLDNFKKISVCILAKNAQKHLKECLEALMKFDEVILLDNQSSDKTQIIARSFSNVSIYESEFIGFGALKNLVASYAKNDWILSIDSDEVLEDLALETIAMLRLEPKVVYSLSRKNLYRDEWIKGCGWSPDFVKRLFNKKFASFNSNQVHESVMIPQNGREEKLNGYLRHYAFESVDELLDKLHRYSSMWADEKSKTTKKASIFGAVGRFVWVFLKDYFFRGGVLYGYKGLVIASCSAGGAFFKYVKLYERRLK